MADGRGFKVNATYETSSDVNTAPEETPHVYDETIRISGPTANATDPSPRITQPPKTKVKIRLLIASVFLGVAFFALVAAVVLIFVLAQKEKRTDDCSSGPCQNNGTCVDMVNSYRCLCSAGYYGTHCQVRDHCRNQPCQNGATCISQNSTYSCSCHSGYTGRNCESGIDECSSRPCQYGGTCVDMVNSYRCLCSAGYYGTNCQVRDRCHSQPCKNGATCIRRTFTYSCSCRSGYTGRNCESVFVNRQPYRLVGTITIGNYSGRVEVYHDGRWGTVCDDDWDNNNAKVFCRSLGLPHSNALGKQSAYFGEGSGVIWLDDVRCTGSESNIGSCSHIGWGNHNCGHYEDAGVICI